MIAMAMFSNIAIGPLVVQRRKCEKTWGLDMEKLALEHSRTTASQAPYSHGS